MVSSFIPPRQVKIGDAAAFVGTTPRAIRHYHSIGLLPEPERGSDDRRRYGYDDMIRLLWIRKMADAGIALDDIRHAFAEAEAEAEAAAAADSGTAPAAAAGGDGDDGNDGVVGILQRLEDTLVAKEAELQRQRAAVQRMRTRGSRVGLFSDLVASRLDTLPRGSLRQADLDNLLVIERIFGPLGAAVNATRYIALATHPELRTESDRVDAAEVALDDTVAVDDPRVAQVAAERHTFELALEAVINDSGLAENDDALFETWEAMESAAADGGSGVGQRTMSAFDATLKMPYDYSPARVRCMELAVELASRDAAAS